MALGEDNATFVRGTTTGEDVIMAFDEVYTVSAEIGDIAFIFFVLDILAS
jgi:hypothetical protein